MWVLPEAGFCTCLRVALGSRHLTGFVARVVVMLLKHSRPTHPEGYFCRLSYSFAHVCQQKEATPDRCDKAPGMVHTGPVTPPYISLT